MEAEDLRNLPWIRVTDWSQLGATCLSESRKVYGVTPKDMKIFIRNICQEISCELNLSYKSVWRVIRSKNKVFFLSSRWFIFWEFPEKNSSMLKKMEELFWVPDISQINKADRCKDLFEQLSPTEKMDFLLEAFDLVGKLIVAQAGEINKAMEEEDSP